MKLKELIDGFRSLLNLRKKNQINEEDFLFSQDEGDGLKLKNENNFSIRNKQNLFLATILMGILVLTCLAILFLQSKNKKKQLAQKPVALKVELADKALNAEVHWRNYYEEQREQDRRDLNDRLKLLEAKQEEALNSTKMEVEEELADTKEKLLMARKELELAGANLQRVAIEEEKRINSAPSHVAPKIDEVDFTTAIEFDEPKSTKNYIPEGTYFNGYLLGGIVVSTGLNTADENSTSVSIRLESRGNLNSKNPLDVSKCHIMGSAYGDLSSERAVIRLEKMICEVDGAYITSRIAGVVYGPDGFNGIKGSVVSTSSKHLKNAMIGGMISGFGSISNGKPAMHIVGGGVLSSKKQDFKDLAKSGATEGISNAGDKLVEYYLKQAESMSPVLTIPAGVRVQAHINKGFSVGEIGTVSKIKYERAMNNENEQVGRKWK